MIRGAHHISLATTDLKRLLWFYHELLGMKLQGVYDMEPGDHPEFETVVGIEKPRCQTASLDLGNLHMEVFCYSQPTPKPIHRQPACDAGIRHIAFDVTDIHAEYARLTAAGVESISPPTFIPMAGATSCYLYDPDGNICELQEIHPGSMIAPAYGVA